MKIKTRVLRFSGIFFIISLFFPFLCGAERLPIIGGESIGPAKLGMTPDEIIKANENSPCPVVEAVFSVQKAAALKAIELRTSWGGGCETPEGMMASTYDVDFLKILYGRPEAVAADWWYYYKLGLAFRVMYTEDGSIVQMISVFAASP